MKLARRHSFRLPGISLVETIVSVGVLAVVIPLALAAMLKASGIGASARADTRAPAIADFCMVELRAAREGNSNYFPKIDAGKDFGSGGSFLSLGFERDGSVIGEISQAQYSDGLSNLDDKKVHFIAKISGRLDTETREVDLVTVEVEVEYPASRDEDKRSVTSFHTKLP